MQGNELKTLKVDFDAEMLNSEPESKLAVTVDPHVPSNFMAAEMGEFGSAPTMTLLHLAGESNVTNLFTHLKRARFAAEKLWPEVRRIYEYYLEGDWARFNASGANLLREEWQPAHTCHERSLAAHRAVEIVLAQIVDDRHLATARFLLRYQRKHYAALRNLKYRSFIGKEIDSGTIGLLQRYTFDTLELFISKFDSWEMGQLRRLIPDERHSLLNEPFRVTVRDAV
ncbi:hypothetical protein [Saccharopolyspora shandongensis]|nr:hypothetical protein [Saccharopolyspora shandongensis]